MSEAAADVRSHPTEGRSHKSKIRSYDIPSVMSEEASTQTRSVTKRVRLTPEEAERLAEVAEDRDCTESDVLREGLEIVSQMHRRRKNLPLIIREAELVPGPEDPNDKSWQFGSGGR